MIFLIMGGFLLANLSWASPEETIAKVARHMANPGNLLGELEILGTSSREEARIIFLPEVHDDPASLLSQLFILNDEKKRGGKIIFLGESIPALEKSPWELFSQRAIAIAAATSFIGPYSSKRFEKALKDITNRLQENTKLKLMAPLGVWSLGEFRPYAEVLFGWDLKKAPMLERNIQLAESLKTVLSSSYDRVVVLLGARHVPELEYLGSLKLICPGHKLKSVDGFFSYIKSTSGAKPKLPHGIGATLPLYEYLVGHKYAILFTKDLYKKLDRAVRPSSGCFDIKSREHKSSRHHMSGQKTALSGPSQP